MRSLRSAAVVFLLPGLLTLVACGGERTLTPLDTAEIRGPELGAHDVGVRVTDRDGNFIRDTPVRFAIIGDGKGAILDPSVVKSDSEGIAKVTLRTGRQAKFTLDVQTDGATPLSIGIEVDKYFGGDVLVNTLNQSTTSGPLELQIRMVDDTDCSRPQQARIAPTTSYVKDAVQVVALPASGANTTFSGVAAGKRFAVVALGRKDGAAVAEACQGGIELKAEEIERGFPINVSLRLTDINFTLYGNQDLITTTNFNIPLGFSSFAAHFNNMSDEGTDPTKYIVEGMVKELEGGAIKTFLVNAGAALIEKARGNPAEQEAKRNKLKDLATRLKEIQTTSMVSKMRLTKHATTDELGQPLWEVDHQFLHMQTSGPAGVQQFPLTPGISLGGDNGPPMVLSAQAQIRFQSTLRMTFDPHELSVPVRDAILARMIYDGLWQEADLRKVLEYLFGCQQLGEVARQYAEENGGGVLIGATVKGVVVAACGKFLDSTFSNLYAALRDDIKKGGYDQNVVFQGSADLGLLPDGSNVGQFTNGVWAGLGSFTAVRL